LSQALFLFHIQFPATLNFDEFHYVPAAKDLITLDSNRNEEHPPLAKILIGIGIKMDGDRPFGWRLMSAFFGSLTLIGIFTLAYFAMGSLRIAWVTALLTLFNQLLFVQARIAMLDTFMTAFLIWAVVFLYRASIHKGRAKDLFICGVLLGLATSCKWFGAMGVLGCVLVGSAIFKFKFKNLLFKMVLPAIAVYFVCQLPLLFVATPDYGFFDLFKLPYKMWQAQRSVQGPHPYHSVWYQWALLIRPMWYAFDKEGPHQEWVRGVILLGNPLIMYLGLVSGIFLFLKKNVPSPRLRPQVKGLIWLYLVFFFTWVVIPRNVSFYYYYYPASCFLGIFIAIFLDWIRRESPHLKYVDWAVVTVACAIFFYFYPILMALKIPADQYVRYMWFRSWI